MNLHFSNFCLHLRRLGNNISFGGWNQSLTALAIFVVVDYVTGIAAYYEGRKNPGDNTKGLNSNKGFWGIFKNS